MSSFLKVSGLTRQFAGAKQAALSGVSFELQRQEFLTLVGASGSGKTTLLRLLAGLEKPDAGEIALEGEILSAGKQILVPPEKRNFGFVFQNHALFPHLSVGDNVGFGLQKGAGRQQRVSELLDLVGLRDTQRRYPHELSGGEQQRIALVRALAPGPGLLLMDEPFSSLDKSLRQELRGETRRLVDEQGATTIMVTHDTTDALAVSDRIVVLRAGRVEQSGSPAEIYHRPVNRYVASAFGACNFLARARLSNATNTRGMEPEDLARDEFWIRPEDLALSHPDDPDRMAVGTVTEVLYQGDCQQVTLACPLNDGGSCHIQVRQPGNTDVTTGALMSVRTAAGSLPNNG